MRTRLDRRLSEDRNVACAAMDVHFSLTQQGGICAYALVTPRTAKDRGCDRAFGQLRGLWHLGGYMPPRSLCARRHKGSAKGKDGMEIFLARPIFNTNAHGQKHIGIEHKTICSVSGQFDVPWLREQGQGVTQELWANQRKADVKITVRRQQNQAGWGGLAPGSMTHCSGLGKIQNRCSCAPC